MEPPSDLMGNGTRDLPACSIVPQPTTLPRASPRKSGSLKCLRSLMGESNVTAFIKQSLLSNYTHTYTMIESLNSNETSIVIKLFLNRAYQIFAIAFKFLILPN
jgi:hypothetical protein